MEFSYYKIGKWGFVEIFLGNLNLNGYLIINICKLEGLDDIVIKQYVDEIVGGGDCGLVFVVVVGEGFMKVDYILNVNVV